METIIGGGDLEEEEVSPEKNNNKEEEEKGKEDTADLLEEFWFFGNLLRKRNRSDDTMMMKRCFSDPCPSFNNNQEMMTSSKPPEDVVSSTETPKAESTDSEAEYEDYPSMDQIYQLTLSKNGNNSASSRKVGSRGTGSGTNEVVEEQHDGSQSHPRLSKSNRQPSLNLSGILPSRASSKVSRCEGSEANRKDSVVEDEDYPSMDQIFQLTLGMNRPNLESTRSHTQDVSSNPMKGENVGDGPTKSSPRVLLRGPSLPPCLGRDLVLGSQSHPRFSKNNRQSSLNLSEILPPRRFSKGAPSYISTDKEMKRRILNRTKSMKNRGDLESEEVQGFKDLGFTFDRKDLNPGLVNILPGLQEKKNKDAEADKEKEEGKGPYLSEAWLSHNFAPPIPKWTPTKGGSPDDMKAHIKFWARAVASNFGQEC